MPVPPFECDSDRRPEPADEARPVIRASPAGVDDEQRDPDTPDTIEEPGYGHGV